MGEQQAGTLGAQGERQIKYFVVGQAKEFGLNSEKMTTKEMHLKIVQQSTDIDSSENFIHFRQPNNAEGNENCLAIIVKVSGVKLRMKKHTI